MAEPTVIELVKRDIDEKELADLSMQCAALELQILNWRIEKETTNARLNSLVKEGREKVIAMSTKITNKFEMQEIECMTAFDSPGPGQKTSVAIGTGIAVRTYDMTVEEKQQRRLDFESE